MKFIMCCFLFLFTEIAYKNCSENGTWERANYMKCRMTREIEEVRLNTNKSLIQELFLFDLRNSISDNQKL